MCYEDTIHTSFSKAFKIKVYFIIDYTQQITSQALISYSFRICSSLMAAVDRLKLSARLRALDSSFLRKGAL